VVLPRVDLGREPSFTQFLFGQTTALAQALCSPTRRCATPVEAPCAPPGGPSPSAALSTLLWGDEPAAAALKRPARDVPVRVGVPVAGVPARTPEVDPMADDKADRRGVPPLPKRSLSKPGAASDKIVPAHPSSPPASPPMKRPSPRTGAVPPAPLGPTPSRPSMERRRDGIMDDVQALLQDTGYRGVVVSSRSLKRGAAKRPDGSGLFGEGADGGAVDGGF